ncbi:verrucotoxin subunit beta-like protein [Labeo rohita]|uniref:Verrucotoxin subunit beta-like protein n=1 Tax=Labeo rohita TaxID=84645 RepID=A0A498LP71_LABRO|nr:verrucotoxin subunit beta-like protein [Labeo rohita]
MQPLRDPGTQGVCSSRHCPLSKKKATTRSDEYSRIEENSLSKMASVLSSEMAELKRLLKSLQPVTCASPVKTTQEDVNVQNQGAGEESLDSLCFSDLDVFSTSASDSFFNDHGDTVDVAVQPSPQDAFTGHPAAEGSSSSPPKRCSKIARTLSSMAEADSIGMGHAPEIEQPVAALVVSPDKALRGNFLQMALLAMGHVTRELGNLTAMLLAARRQVWLAQARLPEDSMAETIEVAALGRPLYPGMLYDCRKDSFIPGVTLWNSKSLNENVDIRPQTKTDLKFSSSDSLSSKVSLLDVSASLKASFLGGLVEVGGSAKYLHDTKSSNQQSRVTMYYSETTSFKQLTMNHLGEITYPQVFNQKTATHVVMAVLYGVQAFMVFDRTFSEEENKQMIEGDLNVMVKKIPKFSIEGKGAINMTDDDKKVAEKIKCTFYGDVRLEQNPTTFTEALEVYKKLPTILKENPEKVVPVKVWLYPLNLLNDNAAQLKTEISASAVSIEVIMEGLEEVERTYNDFPKTLVSIFSDVTHRLRLFKNSLRNYKAKLLKKIGSVLPTIREGEKEEKLIEDILKIHNSSPFNADMLKQWLDDAKSELDLLNSNNEMLNGIKMENADNLNTIHLNPNIEFVVCLTFTSLSYKDPYLSTLTEFKGLDEKQNISLASVRKWFRDPDVIIKMRENLGLFKSFSEANKDEKRIHFIISAISNPSSPGSSIYLYEKGKLTDTQFQPVSKPPPPIVKDTSNQIMSLRLQKSPTGKTVQYRVEYKEVKSDSGPEEQWDVQNTADEDFTQTGLESGKKYLIRYRIVGKVGWSMRFKAIKVVSNTGYKYIDGDCHRANYKEFLFDDKDKIVEENHFNPVKNIKNK